MSDLKIKDGVIKRKDEIRAMHPNTSFAESTYAELGWQDYTLPPYVPTLDEAKASKRNEINLWRDMEEEKPLSWNGRNWQMRRSDREKIMGVALAGIAPPTGYWTDANDNDVPMTVADMQALYTAGIARIAAIHAHQRGRKAALDLLTDIADVQGFNPAEGWAG